MTPRKAAAVSRQPYLLGLGPRGYIEGVTIYSHSTTVTESRPRTQSSSTALCRYFGGLRYGISPTRRWGRARPLPRNFTYGTRDRPGQHDGEAAVCPQVGFSQQIQATETLSEDCFECNVWLPIAEGKETPKEGWPVFFFIHGGFLQFGSANSISPAYLLGESDFKCIIVAPAYRVGVLGFLSCDALQAEGEYFNETNGNQGLWDQRLALEWTRDNIHLFGGNASNITVAGYSAGAYSVFQQLAYEVRQPEKESIIRQVVMWSNGPGVQPKRAPAAEQQFNELTTALDIPANISGKEKLSILRSCSPKVLIEAGNKILHHQFRPWTDGTFVSNTLFGDVDNGDFARRLRARGIRLMIGECRDEHFAYGTWRTPANSLMALRKRIEADYPVEACDALVNLYYPSGALPKNCTDWRDAFGRLYADIQVHMLQRGLLNTLARGGASHLVYRYRMEFRLKCVDKIFPPSWGITHASDMPLWFWGNGLQIEPEEKDIVSDAFLRPLSEFVRGNPVNGWGTNTITQCRRLNPDGRVDIWHDHIWEEGLRVWETLRQVGSTGEPSRRRKL